MTQGFVKPYVRETISVITLIKYFRLYTGLGLVEAKYAVERFLDARKLRGNLSNISIDDVMSFFHYIWLFNNKSIGVSGHVGCGTDTMKLIYVQPEEIDEEALVNLV